MGLHSPRFMVLFNQSDELCNTSEFENSPLECFPSEPGTVWWSVHVASTSFEMWFNFQWTHRLYRGFVPPPHKSPKVENQISEGFSVPVKGDSMRDTFSFFGPPDEPKEAHCCSVSHKKCPALKASCILATGLSEVKVFGYTHAPQLDYLFLETITPRKWESHARRRKGHQLGTCLLERDCQTT